MKINKALACLLPAAAACSSYGGSDYPGEPLAVIHGSIEGTGEPRDLRAALYLVDAPSEVYDPVGYVDVETEGSFPASFTLNLYEPPPEHALLVEEDGGRWQVGGVVAYIHFGPNDDFPIGQACPSVVFFESDVTADSLLGLHFGAFSAGYHVVEATDFTWVRNPHADEQNQACFEDLVVTTDGSEEQRFGAAAYCNLWVLSGDYAELGPEEPITVFPHDGVSHCSDRPIPPVPEGWED